MLVCKGNIIRSPFAENWIRQRGALSQEIHVRSRGTERYHEGKGAHLIALAVATEFGVDLSLHVAHQVSESDVLWADLVLAFDLLNVERLVSMFSPKTTPFRLELIGHYLSPQRENVMDPVFGPPTQFRESFRSIRDACVTFLDRERLVGRTGEEHNL